MMLMWRPHCGCDQEEEAHLVTLFHLHLEEWIAKCNQGMPLSVEEMEWLNDGLLGLEDGRSPQCTNAFHKMTQLMAIVENTFNTYYYDQTLLGNGHTTVVVRALRAFRASLYERNPAIRKVLDERQRVQRGIEEVMQRYGLTWERYLAESALLLLSPEHLPLPKDRMDSKEYEAKVLACEAEYRKSSMTGRGWGEQEASFGAYYHVVEKVSPMDAAGFRKALGPLLRRSVELTAELKLLKIRFKYDGA
jgi:hypothetical protein